MNYGSYDYDFELSELKADRYGLWDQFVEDSPQGTVFQKISWLKSYEEYNLKLLAITHKETIVAGIPIPFVNRLGVRFAVNPPFTGYLGVLFRKSSQKYNVRLSMEREFSKILAKNLKEFTSYVRYVFHYNFVDATPFLDLGYSAKPYYMYILNLRENLDKILGEMEKDTRNRIRRAEKYGLHCTDGSPAEIAELVCLSYNRKNQAPAYSKETYEKMLTAFSKNVPYKSLVIKDKEEAIAGGIIVYDGKRAYYLCAGIRPRSEFKGINQLLVWTLIKHVKENLKLNEFDLQGWANEGIERFLRGFGPTLTQGLSINSSSTYCQLIDAARNMRRTVTTKH